MKQNRAAAARPPAGAVLRALARWWRYLPDAAKSPLRRVAFAPLDARDRLLGRDPGLPPRWLRAMVGDEFTAVGREFLGHLRLIGRLTAHEAVLDIGCGCGRMALPLTGYLRPPGSYDGFDIVPQAVAWCSAHITPLHPHFRFQCLDLRNRRYRPHGLAAAAAARFPYPDAAFDLAFAASIHTHLDPDECRRYLAETRRVLRPEGRALLTFFLVTEAAGGLPAPRPTGMAFVRTAPGVHTLRQRPGDTHFAVAYDEDRVRDWLREAGLEPVEPILLGRWSGRADGPSFQDIVLVRPLGNGRDRSVGHGH